jgi:hypothetical protein
MCNGNGNSFANITQAELSACVQEQVRVTNLARELELGFALEDAAELDSGRGVAVPAPGASQEMWLGYRDAQCEYRDALFAGGTGGCEPVAPPEVLDRGRCLLLIE